MTKASSRVTTTTYQSKTRSMPTPRWTQKAASWLVQMPRSHEAAPAPSPSCVTASHPLPPRPGRVRVPAPRAVRVVALAAACPL